MPAAASHVQTQIVRWVASGFPGAPDARGVIALMGLGPRVQGLGRVQGVRQGTLKHLGFKLSDFPVVGVAEVRDPQ